MFPVHTPASHPPEVEGGTSCHQPDTSGGRLWMGSFQLNGDVDSNIEHLLKKFKVKINDELNITCAPLK